jgi:5-hydroxyisourate hydrolase
MARISTHVLDIANGAPAVGIVVELFASGRIVHSCKTNADGRTDSPLLTADRIPVGPYELVFHVEEYLRAERPAEPPFFDSITLRFVADDEAGNYHIPLLLAAHGYSTYRGS